jgi:hypothetical protein
MWIAQAECLFELQGFTCLVKRYCYVVASLTHKAMRRVTDLVEQWPDQDPYAVLKKAAEQGQVRKHQEEGEVGQAGAFWSPVSATATGSTGSPLLPATSLACGRETARPGELNAISPSNLLHLHDQLSGKHFLVDTTPPTQCFLIGLGGCPIATWGEKEIPILFDGQHFTWNFLLSAVQIPILGMDFLRQQGLLVDVGENQLIMTASMKVIRAVAPSGGPGGLYTAVASSSTEYRHLFSEYQDVTPHKEKLPRPKHDMEHHLQVSGLPLTAKGRLQGAEHRRLQSTA